uniref:Anillin n=1 Tax=Stegastes partitus TaxID=144197 RepID=A0A3B4ZML3_9TELE
MDPFTEKLLERTRARRENLQKKMAERPNAANRQMVKRPREPLADTNSVITETVIDKVPQVSSKPSPSKRRCSGENVQPAASEEIQEPMMTRAAAPVRSDPPTDKKPPAGPASIRSSSSLEKNSPRPIVQSQLGQLETAQPEAERMTVSSAPDPPKSREAQMEPASSSTQRSKEDLVEDPAPSAPGMKSRLQRLAQQRKYWDGDGKNILFYCSNSFLKKCNSDAPPAAVPTVSSGTPLGRKGRLANLAATIGTWEDDLSHANIPKEKPAPASVPKFAVRDAPVAASTKQSTEVTTSAQAVCSPAKPSRVVLPSPQKADIPASKPALQSVTSPQKSSNQGVTFPSSPQKSSIQGKAFPSITQKAGQPSSSSASVPQSPVKNQALSRGLNLTSSPLKPELRAKTAADTFSVSFLYPYRRICHYFFCFFAFFCSIQTGVKSFLERFGERCQERNNHGSPSGVTTQTKTPTVTPSVTPNTRLVQERLRAAQSANTTSADLTQRQKLVGRCSDAVVRKPRCSSCTSTSSPLKVVTQTDETPKEEEKEVVTETEMNVDQSINSAVINELFDGVLEQSEDEDDEDEEEDALNISSMSLLTPLAETVAAVVKSPERRMMTSTPASSFIVKNNNPDIVSKPSKFQRANMIRTASSDSVEALDEDHKLPYSIDAYRSTRVKETERPSVKQVIVRKEDVSHRAEEPRGSSLFSIKQKMKVLTNEMNLQQTVIHQASQALNCCTDEEHGKGSQVEAEAERLLLVATERREALKAELDRLKGDPAGQKKVTATPLPTNMSASKGSISLQELRLPLKADFVCSTANKPESTKHSFFIMLRAGAENTVATPLASTHRGLSGDTLTFPTKFTISDVSSDFEIDIEVYCLVSVLRYGLHLTISTFLSVVVASPGGPNAVRTSNFVLVGSHKLTLSSIGKNKFSLEKVPFLCPLEGHIYLKMQCEVGSKVEERGFLTMFEDVSGFGAWHRRWCVLSGYCISYWTYPDDEKRKNPIGRINLANCTSKMVEPANREFCARPNTFELITVRPQREDDKETLVSQCKNTMCVTKNWLSADTKDERNLWMKKLNQILVDLRMWQPDACYRPL